MYWGELNIGIVEVLHEEIGGWSNNQAPHQEAHLNAKPWPV